jgi:hypothetical protein
MPGKEVIAAIRGLLGKAEIQWQQIDDERHPFALGNGEFIGGCCALPLCIGELQLQEGSSSFRCGSGVLARGKEASTPKGVWSLRFAREGSNGFREMCREHLPSFAV